MRAKTSPFVSSAKGFECAGCALQMQFAVIYMLDGNETWSASALLPAQHLWFEGRSLGPLGGSIEFFDALIHPWILLPESCYYLPD